MKEKTFFEKYRNFLGLVFLAFIFTALRTENGRCTILPFIFSERCSVEDSNQYFNSNKPKKSLNDIGKTAEDVNAELRFDLSESSFYEFNEQIIPLNNIPKRDYQNPEISLTIFGRCSAIQMVDFPLNDPNPEKRFDNMSFFIKAMYYNMEKISPSEIDVMVGIKSVFVHEYFIGRYNEILESDFIDKDREFCSNQRLQR